VLQVINHHADQPFGTLLEEDGARQLCQTLGICTAPTPCSVLKNYSAKKPTKYDGLSKGVRRRMS
jgi:hypothetical protein